jgi:curved DNA-binding protein CbpA
VTQEQLHLAYQDRSQQLPRKEYSPQAIAARKALLDRAYQILSSPTARGEYDAQLLVHSYSLDGEAEPPTKGEERENSLPDTHITCIEIDPEQLVGALLILQELGEYEIVLNLGETYLDRPLQPPDSLIQRADIVLTVACAYLELSREQWQQQEYEQAGLSGQKGLDLLKKEHLFPTIQAEIHNELYKLRHYQILELLALPEHQVQKRAQGMGLLQEMLQQRNGIDGKGNDHSGLNVDNFLRFIQQLRVYLSVEEQQALFATEAKRPSAVASYLQVYTLIARGFVQKQPAWIFQAKEMLQLLATSQDVYLEEAICSLLLGQTGAASQALAQTQERETLAFIRENSHESDDLLAGLCLYAENWLQNEVFSHFRDLATQEASLKDYFADEAVQSYVEELSFGSQAQHLGAEDGFTPGAGLALASSDRSSVAGNRWTGRGNQNLAMGEPVFAHAQSSTGIYPLAATTASTGGLVNQSQLRMGGRRKYGELNREYTQGNVALAPSYLEPSKRDPRRRRRGSPAKAAHQVQTPVNTATDLREKKKKKSYKIKPFRLSMAILVVLTATGVLLRAIQDHSSHLTALNRENLAIQLNRPPLDIPAADAHVVVAGNLTELAAMQVIQEWLLGKSQALGVNYQSGKLKVVLAEPMLSLWLKRSRALRSSKNYYQYEHQIQVHSVRIDSRNPNLATVEAQVREKAQYYQNGKLNSSRSYDDNLLVRYELIRQQNQWKIRAGQVL